MRVTNAPASRERRRRILDRAKGFRGGHSKLIRQAMEAVDNAMKTSTVDRYLRKRNYRSLWIQRINAATRALGMSYSRFIEGLTKANITVNRKMLSEIAINDPEGFKQFIEKARAALA